VEVGKDLELKVLSSSSLHTEDSADCSVIRATRYLEAAVFETSLLSAVPSSRGVSMPYVVFGIGQIMGTEKMGEHEVLR
jgi:hypothetical protein